jgi:hypothetical protein
MRAAVEAFGLALRKVKKRDRVQAVWAMARKAEVVPLKPANRERA